jgi:uncharacterized membrane protein YeaQ/YmgE (transglycosylase-associated protein family)
MFRNGRTRQETIMSDVTVLIWVVVGAVAGLLAGMIVEGRMRGLVGDNIVIGIIGAFFGGGLLTQLGVSMGSGLIGSIAIATLGAVVLLALSRMARAANRSARDNAHSTALHFARP